MLLGRIDRQRRSVWLPALATVVLATLFVAGRVASAGSDDVGTFVVAGTTFTDGRAAHLPTLRGPGYDGQFFFRLSADPFDFSPRAAGVQVDNPIRFQRVGYPLLVYLTSFGSTSAVPYLLVAVNIAALAAIAAIGASYARSFGRAELWGLLFPVYFGFTMALSRDLSEIVEVAFLLLALWLVRRREFLLAAAALSVCVLTRETALFAVAGIAAWRLWTVVRGRDRLGRLDTVWLAPILVFATWQLVVWTATDRVAAVSATSNHFVFPGSELIRSLFHWFPTVNLVWIVHTMELMALALVVCLALGVIRRSAATPYERAAFVALLVGALSVNIKEGLWLATTDFRSFADLYVMALVVLLGSRARLGAAALMVSASTAGAMLTLVRFI
ncbi:MAG: AZOBR_p60025 family cell surface glycopolymer formation protein [Acidimicrobiia bacterium]